ncbi:unnamed protein product, partial [Prorocentrum cordatum]
MTAYLPTGPDMASLEVLAGDVRLQLLDPDLLDITPVGSAVSHKNQTMSTREEEYAAQAVLSNYQDGFFQALSFEGAFLDCKAGAEAEKKQRIEGPVGPKIFVGSLPDTTNEE